MNIDNIQNINYLWSELIMEELFRNGIKYICISPGSRSTPLTLAAAKHKELVKKIHFDERGLAFYALGIASATGEPVVIVSTSGTAVANFFPALIEASKKKLPLIFITADRPPELRKSGSLQTIDQPGIFGKYVRWETDLPVPDKKIRPEFILTTVDQAIFMARNPLPGPVHINCMFRKPLEPIKSKDVHEYTIPIDERWKNSRSPFTTYFKKEEKIKEKIVKKLTDIIEKTGSGIIVAGKLRNIDEAKAVVKLSEHLGWPLFGDIVSGTRNLPGKNSINNWDLLLLDNDLFKEEVNTIIHLGGRITSNRWYEFIKKNRPENYITILNHPLKNDPLHLVSHRIFSSPCLFANEIIRNSARKERSSKIAFLLKLSDKTGMVIKEFINSRNKLDEIFVAMEISKLVEDETILFLGNSMPVRDMDMFYCGGEKEILWEGNRGTSGIDGNIASASGFSEGSERPLTLVIGDIAALHDLNSLSIASKSKKNFNAVILNNNGGGIFSYLPVSDYWGDSKNYFTTPHNLNFKKAAEMFELGYYKVSDKNEFKKSFKSALKSGKNNLIEVFIDMETSVESHKKLIEKLVDFYNISNGGKSE